MNYNRKHDIEVYIVNQCPIEEFIKWDRHILHIRFFLLFFLHNFETE